ncbi:LuxR C-terminal-related transcriptional regulator [Myroides sp. LJL115]
MLRLFFPLFCMLFFVFGCVTTLRAQSIDKESLFEQIHTLNTNGQYEDSIIILEEIISTPTSDYYDKYLSYYLKYLTYKRLYSYDKAVVNLDLALENGLKSPQYAQEVTSQIKFEKVFVAFDLQQFHTVRELIGHIQDGDFAFIPDYTHAMYLSVVGTLYSKDGDNQRAVDYLDQAIEILKKGTQVDLPLLYRKKIDFYRQMGLYDNAIESFEKGMYYAKKYNMDMYIANLYMDITYYYNQIQDFEKAAIAQQITNELTYKYDEKGALGRLNVLESSLQKKMYEQKSKQNQYILLILSGVFVLLVMVSIVIYFRNKKSKRIALEVLEKNQLLGENLSLLKTYVSGRSFTKQQMSLLNPRQKEIVQLVKKGKSNKEIAELLFVTENTVKYHLKNIFRILDISTREEL